MNQPFAERDELSTLGRVLKKERESGCYTGQEVAQIIGLSKQMISDIERGSKNVSFEKIKLYADFFDIRCKSERNFKNSFWDCINFLVYADYDSFVDKTKNLLKAKMSQAYTPDAPLYYLLEMIYCFIVDDYNGVKNDIKIINGYFVDLYSPEEYFIYLLYRGNYYCEQLNWQDALKIYNQAISKFSNICDDLKGMLYYGLGFVYWKMGNPINSLISHQKAKQLFDSTNNYIRALYTCCHIGMNLMHLYRFDDAEEYYNEVFKTAQLLHINKVINAVRFNMAENYFYKGDYEKAVAVSQECIDEGLYLMQMNDIQMWSYYKLGDLQKCSRALEQLKKAHDGLDEYYRLMIGTMQAILERNETKIVQYLKLLYVHTEEDNIFIVQDFILDLLIENLSKQKRFREAMDYSRIQMNLLKRKMSEPRKN